LFCALIAALLGRVRACTTRSIRMKREPFTSKAPPAVAAHYTTSISASMLA
jgi:hypothetical protein